MVGKYKHAYHKKRNINEYVDSTTGSTDDTSNSTDRHVKKLEKHMQMLHKYYTKLDRKQERKQRKQRRQLQKLLAKSTSNSIMVSTISSPDVSHDSPRMVEQNIPTVSCNIIPSTISATIPTDTEWEHIPNSAPPLSIPDANSNTSILHTVWKWWGVKKDCVS